MDTPAPTDPAHSANPPEPVEPASLAEQIRRLQGDRSWLLRQVDGGRWPELHMDLAALERELGQLLERWEIRMDHN